MLGFNGAALNFIKRELELTANVQFFDLEEKLAKLRIAKDKSKPNRPKSKKHKEKNPVSKQDK